MRAADSGIPSLVQCRRHIRRKGRHLDTQHLTIAAVTPQRDIRRLFTKRIIDDRSQAVIPSRRDRNSMQRQRMLQSANPRLQRIFLPHHPSFDLSKADDFFLKRFHVILGAFSVSARCSKPDQPQESWRADGAETDEAAVQKEKENLPLRLADLLSSAERVRFRRGGPLLLLPHWLVCKAQRSVIDHGHHRLGNRGSSRMTNDE